LETAKKTTQETKSLETIISTAIPDMGVKVEILKQNDSFVFRMEDSEKTVQAVVSTLISNRKEYSRFVSAMNIDPEFAASILVSKVSKPKYEDKVIAKFEGEETQHSDLQAYVDSISQYPLLNQMQEKQLSKKIRKGDKDALENLVTSNLRLVISFANRYKYLGGIDFFDLIQEGNKGLIMAAQKYNYRRNTRFATYAYHWIMQGIFRHVQKSYLVAPQTYAKWKKLRQIEQSICSDNNGLLPTRQEFLKHIRGRFSEYELDNYLARKDFKLVSCDSENFLEPGIETNASEISEKTIDVAHAITLLNSKQKRFVKMRYGFPPYAHGHTLEEIGDKVHLTRERVRQILYVAEKNIKEYLITKDRKELPRYHSV